MKTLLVLLALLAVGCAAHVKPMANRPECYCDGPVIDDVCDGVLVCTYDQNCSLNAGECRK